MNESEDYVDITIEKTPRPQAFSTVQRCSTARIATKAAKSATRAKSKELQKKLYAMDTSLSSMPLGKISETVKEKDNASVRQQKAVQHERVPSRVPSFLLKPCDSSDSSSIHCASLSGIADCQTADLKKLFESANNSNAASVSFDKGEITAHSSSFGNSSSVRNSIAQDKDSVLRELRKKIQDRKLSLSQLCKDLDPSRISMFISSVDGKSLCKSFGSDTSLDMVCKDEFINELQKELFTDSEIENNFKTDECKNDLENVKEHAGVSKDLNSFNASSFSSFVNDDCALIKLDDGTKIPIYEYFRIRTGKLDELELKNSPEKELRSTLQEQSERTADMSNADPVSVESYSVVDSSVISKVIKSLNTKDSPGTVVKKMQQAVAAKKKSKQPQKRCTKASMSSRTTDVQSKDTLEASQCEFPLQVAEKPFNSASTQSSSRTFSELAFSETDSEGKGGSWVKTQPEEEFRSSMYSSCVGLPTQAKFRWGAISDRWILLRLKLISVSLNGAVLDSPETAVNFKLPSEPILLNPRETKSTMVEIVPLVTGDIELRLEVKFEDMVTKCVKLTEQIVCLKVGDAKVVTESDSIDFNQIPEGCCKTIKFRLTNTTDITLPVRANILQKHNCFSLEQEVEKNMKKTSSQVVLLPPKASFHFKILMEGCKIEKSLKSVAYQGSLQFSVATNDTYLKEVAIIGKVAYTNMQFEASCNPLSLDLGETKPIIFRNAGCLPMPFSIYVKENRGVNHDQHLILENHSAVVLPKQTLAVNVTLKEEFEGIRYVYFEHPGKPIYRCPVRSSSLGTTPVLLTSFERPDSVVSATNSATEKNITSSGSTASLEDGKLPVEVSKIELTWSTVRLGKSSTQSFTLRNRSMQKLKFQIGVSADDFKIVRERAETASSMSLVMQGRESRLITVKFSPLRIGAIANSLVFTPMDSSKKQWSKQVIKLNGYGGHTNLDIRNIARDSAGKMWLSFGHLDLREVVEQTFVLRNSGNLPAFAFLQVKSNGLCSFVLSKFSVQPSCVVLPPNSSKTITIKFTPKRDEFDLMRRSRSKEVTEIASLNVIFGPESTRGRLRKITAVGCGSSLVSNSISNELSKVFPNEKIPEDLKLLKESLEAEKILLQGLISKEIILTVEQNLDETTLDVGGVDDTCFFQSLAEETVIENTTQY